LAFTIPLSSIAGPLAVSFTVAAPEEIPVQVPQRPAETVEETSSAPAEEPPPQPSSGPPVLPDSPGAAVPPPQTPPTEPSPEPAPTPTADPFPEPTVVAPSLPGDIAPTEEAPAEPATPRLLKPTDKRSFFSLSAGGATSPVSYYGSSIGFSTEMVVGRYGKRRPNLGGAFVLQYRKSAITEVGLAGRFRARKQLTKAFSLYTVFDATLGLNVPVAFGGYVYPYIPSAQLGIGWGLEAILAERVTVGLRPFAPNIVAPNFFGFPVALRWDFGVSLGIVW